MTMNKQIMVYALLLFLSACSQSGIDVTANFKNTQDIKEGVPVLFQERVVGEVVDVSSHNTGSVVRMTIHKDASTMISEKAAVVVNRVKPGAPLELHNPAGELSQSLQDGQSVTGMDSLLELMAWSVGDALNQGGREFASILSGFQDYLKGDEFQQNKAEFQQQVKQATESASEALKTIEDDITQAVNDMVASEEQVARSIEELGEELSPVVEELSRSGTQLAIELDKFAQNLENAAPDEQASGQRLMESLINTLENLNRSMEKGAQQAQP